LDHVSHDFDILQRLLGNLQIEHGQSRRFGPVKVIHVTGFHEHGSFAILEVISDYPLNRFVRLRRTDGPLVEIPIGRWPPMHRLCWEYILSGQGPADLSVRRAMCIQRYLEETLVLSLKNLLLSEPPGELTRLVETPVEVAVTQHIPDSLRPQVA